MAQPHKYLAEKSSGSEFRLLSTDDLRMTDAVIGPGASVPGDIAVWADYLGKRLADSGVTIADLLNGGGGMVPYLIPAGETFTVPVNKQGLFTITIDVQGTLIVDGYLIQVF